MAKKTKEPEELEQIIDEANEIRTWMDKSTEDHALILDVIGTLIETTKKILLTIDVLREEVFIQKEIKTKEPEPVYRKTSPGFKTLDGNKPSRRVVEWTKKNGEIGLKVVGGDVIFEKQAFRYLQECKYGCGNYISFDNYKKGQKALHIDQDLNAIGRYCPKYE